MTSFCVLTPVGQTELREHRKCRTELARLCPSVRFIDVECSYSLDQARSVLATSALDTGTEEVLLWIDGDILFRAEDAVGLVERCASGPYDILGGAYAKKAPGTGLSCRFTEGVQSVTFFAPGLHPAASLGMGFTAVRRRVFERLVEGTRRVAGLPRVHATAHARECWPFFAHVITGAAWLQEDLAFCARAADVGFSLGVDVEPRIEHVGSYRYRVEDAFQAVPSAGSLTVAFEVRT